ncbi:MAG: hypothetical protein L3K00_08155 [Thermoplasmata archaeon]|nr:hypothetical protein [Thermoplasmata archaeon]
MRRLRCPVARLALLLALTGVLVAPGGFGFAAGSASIVPAVPAHDPAASAAASVPAPAPAPAAPQPSATLPTFEWGLAFILYGQGDDTTHFMGEGAAMVVDNQLRNITTFGGEGSGGLTNSTVNYNYSAGYFNVTQNSPSPSARTNVSFADVPGKDFAVLFGGLTNLRTQRTANDTWVYYFANQTWFNVTHALAPPARQSAAFAVNASGNIALLEGGWNPTYTANGSGAAVIWNDTWSLNLTTFDWTELHPTAAPPPLFGSGLIWQNVTNRFDLFGGCALACSSTLWTYGGVPANWHKEATTGTPSARASDAFVWDGEDGVGILVGGFSWSGSGAQALGDQYLLSPGSLAWSILGAGGGPGPRYDAPNAWADFPGCIGLNILGGDISLAGPPQNASLLEPFGGPATDCFPNLIAGGGSPPPPPCSVQSVPLELRVTDNVTGHGIANATVTIDGKCLDSHLITNSAGYLNATLPAPDVLNFTASAAGYRDRTVVDRFLPNTTNFVGITLLPDPSLDVQAWGLGISGVPVPLANVAIQEGQYRILGGTDAEGWLNTTPLVASPGPLVVSGALVNYSGASVGVVVPVTGRVVANLTLLAAGPLDLHIVDGTTGLGVAAVNEEMRDLDLEGPALTPFSVDAQGWYNVSALDAANYSISAGAAGYLSNQTTFDHPWIEPQIVVLSLPEESGATLDVFVQNSATGGPIPAATVRLVGFATLVSTPTGWANFSDVKPPNLYPVQVNATGFTSNYTVVSLSFFQKVAPYVVDLTPLPTCPGSPSCSPGTSGTNGPPFGFVTSGGGVGVLLLATPVALLWAGALYALVVLRRSPRRAPASPVRADPGR